VCNIEQTPKTQKRYDISDRKDDESNTHLGAGLVPTFGPLLNFKPAKYAERITSDKGISGMFLTFKAEG
jgi:hypothetical protein